MRTTWSFSGLSPSQVRYSGPSSPHQPGQPSADAYPSSEVMKSTTSSDICIPSVGTHSLAANRSAADEGHVDLGRVAGHVGDPDGKGVGTGAQHRRRVVPAGGAGGGQPGGAGGGGQRP